MVISSDYDRILQILKLVRVNNTEKPYSILFWAELFHLSMDFQNFAKHFRTNQALNFAHKIYWYTLDELNTRNHTLGLKYINSIRNIRCSLIGLHKFHLFRLRSSLATTVILRDR